MKKYSISKDVLYDLYHTKKMSCREIAIICGYGKITILNHLKKHGIEVRNRNGEYGPRFTVDVDYFKNFSPDMAYVLGIMGSDGYVRPNKYEMGIKSIDLELLEYVKKQLKSNYKIRADYHNRKPVYCCSIYSKIIVNDLIAMGIMPRKSLIFEMPTIPSEYFWHFLRGYIDGDGWLGAPLDESRQIKIAITGSFMFVNQVIQLLKDKIDLSKFCVTNAGKAKTVYISGKNAYDIVKNCYDNDFFALERKKHIARKIISHYHKSTTDFCRVCNKIMTGCMRPRKYCDNCSKLSYKKLKSLNVVKTNRL